MCFLSSRDLSAEPVTTIFQNEPDLLELIPGTPEDEAYLVLSIAAKIEIGRTILSVVIPGVICLPQ